MAATETITTAGRILKAQWVGGDAVQGMTWIAIGDGTWADKANPPAVSLAATGLTHEVARKRVERTAWMELDNLLGTVFWKGNLYKEVAGPTTIRALFATFSPEQANGVQICEEGVFGGVITTTAFPYALAAEVTAVGTLYWVRNRPVYTKQLGDTFTAVAIFEEK